MTDFVLVPASTLSLTDDFMRYTPKTGREKDFKELLTKVIKAGVSDFYRPKLDPSFDKQGKICYQSGLNTATYQSYDWWKKSAKEFCTERSSRLGTKSEYVAFLGVLIKRLVESGWRITDAWNAVCNDSKEIGHYWNSVGALHNFEPTGSREICGFCDLANTFKILAKDKEADGFWLAGGYYGDMGGNIPLADLVQVYYFDLGSVNCVGWIVLEA